MIIFKMAWILLILGGICEVGFTTCLQESDNLTCWSKNWPWAISDHFVEVNKLIEHGNRKH
jgi:multidrug transporter EmrE-like cation transporter